ncbi:MAG: S46 family peptidase [Bacteroidales bacterium]
MLKKFLFVLLVASVFPFGSLKADEGMWMPFLLNDALYQEMKGMGLNLDRDEVFSFTESSLKDAIVSFGGFCTGEIISDQGLVLTNHHCGAGRIQTHSSVDSDLLKNGFWAGSFEEELPNPGLFVRFLYSVEDVTDQFDAVLQPTMTVDERNAAIRMLSGTLVKEATEGNHFTANVRSMFAGNEFYLFMYETFTDVRLVGAPPASVGEFGGDTDNWMWPRHTGDFSLFRVYAGPDGKPADYSTDNVPLKPRHHLPVSIDGVKEDDFAMVLGYPGSTSRYLTSHGIEFNLDNMYQTRIDIRRRKLDIMEEAMATSDEIRIQYASKQSGTANGWKNFIGMSRSLKRLDVASTKRELEQEFIHWVNASPERKAEYGDVLSNFDQAYEGLRNYNSQNYVFMEAMASGPEILRLANSFTNLLALLENKEKVEEVPEETRKLKQAAERMFGDFNQQVDKKLWAAMFEEYYQRIDQENLPEVFQVVERRHRNDFQAYADQVYKASIFSSMERLNSFLENPSAKVLRNDPALVAARSVWTNYRQVSRQMNEYNQMIATAERLFLKGLREMKPDELFYPDANSTMRLTYGSVGGYQPADAVYYDYKTTLEGVMQKEDPDNHEFVVDPKLKELYENKDYGRYGDNGEMVVNFLSNNDITGGNSGSPVINGDGHLIGTAFDGNWEAMSGDILFEPELQRCINADARYILFVIEKLAGSTRLIDEMTVIKNGVVL